MNSRRWPKSGSPSSSTVRISWRLYGQEKLTNTAAADSPLRSPRLDGGLAGRVRQLEVGGRGAPGEQGGPFIYYAQEQGRLRVLTLGQVPGRQGGDQPQRQGASGQQGLECVAIHHPPPSDSFQAARTWVILRLPVAAWPTTPPRSMSRALGTPRTS